MNLNDKFTELKNWCIKNGSFINEKIIFNSENNIYSSNQIINSNETIFEISQQCNMTSEQFSELPFINNENLEIFDSVEKLILVLIYNLFIKEESFYKEYIDILPELDSFKNHPIYILKPMITNPFELTDEIKILLGSYVNSIKEIDEKINLLYDKITSINPIYKKIINKDNLLYGFLIVKTRSLDNKTLVPIIDLIPYSNESHTVLEVSNSAYLFKSTQEYQPNKPISYNYDEKSTLEFYFHYNIILETNTNKLSINITNDKIKELFNDKISNIVISFNNIQPDLLALCRIQSLSELELNKIYELKNIQTTYDFINLENELSAYKILLNIFSNCKKDIEEKVKISLKLKDSNNIVLQNFSKIFLNINDSINKSILTVLFLWNNMLNSPIKYNINMD